MRSVTTIGVLAMLGFAICASADTVELPGSLFSAPALRDPWRIDWLAVQHEATAPVPIGALAIPSTLLQQDDPQPLHARAVEHSDAYQTRARIHKYASFATLPLFAAELALGQSLYDGPTNAGGRKGAHAVIGTGIIALFGVNTVTGAWNLFGEGWSERDGRTLRLVHGLLMMAAEAGFAATAASAPSSGRNGALTFAADEVTHRNLAIGSISVGTAGYLLMLLGNR